MLFCRSSILKHRNACTRTAANSILSISSLYTEKAKSRTRSTPRRKKAWETVKLLQATPRTQIKKIRFSRLKVSLIKKMHCLEGEGKRRCDRMKTSRAFTIAYRFGQIASICIGVAEQADLVGEQSLLDAICPSRKGLEDTRIASTRSLRPQRPCHLCLVVGRRFARASTRYKSLLVARG